LSSRTVPYPQSCRKESKEKEMSLIDAIKKNDHFFLMDCRKMGLLTDVL
jgi:hypothetical protein